jgi:GntR family transcriptional regulator, transcriptional repressor for pyruvate dehydrogenase complex
MTVPQIGQPVNRSAIDILVATVTAVTSPADTTAPVPRGLAPLQTIEPVSAVSAVTRRLLDFFTSGEIAAGDRLPAERLLAAQLGVGRSAVREALAALELLGIVSVRPGSGTYLKGSVSELLPQTLSWGLWLGEPKTLELIQVRQVLEVQVARLAADHASDEQRRTIRTTIETMRAHRGDFSVFVEADMRFHQVIAEAAGNSLLTDLLTTVRSLIRVWVERAVNDTAHTNLTLREHTAIAKALDARDADAAGTAMQKHMKSAGDRLLTSLDASA